MKTKFLFFFLAVLPWALLAQFRPINLVTGIGYTEADGVYTFHPICGDHPCSKGELHLHVFRWKFSETDYSVAQHPSRKFTDGNPLQVILVATGTKEEDPVERRSAPPSNWLDKQFFLELRPRTSTGIFPGEYPAFGLPFPDIEIGAPSSEPVPGGFVTYPVILANRTDCAYRGTIKASLPMGGATLEIDPVASPLGLAAVDPLTGNLHIRDVVLPPKTQLVTLLRLNVEASIAIGDHIRFSVTSEFPAPDSTNVNCPTANDAEEADSKVVVALDPNRKYPVNGEVFAWGAWVEYKVEAENSGKAPETSFITVKDRISPLFDRGTLEIIAVTVGGRRLDYAPLEFPAYDTVHVGDTVAYRLSLSPDTALEPGDILTIHYRIRLKGISPVQVASALHFLGEVAKDPTRTPVIGDAKTSFGSEGKWYLAKTYPEVFVQEEGSRGIPWLEILFGMVLTLLATFYRRLVRLVKRLFLKQSDFIARD